MAADAELSVFLLFDHVCKYNCLNGCGFGAEQMFDYESIGPQRIHRKGKSQRAITAGKK